MSVINKINTRLNVANWLAPWQQRQKKGLVDGKNSFNVSIGLTRVQVTYALLHLREIPRFAIHGARGLLALNQVLI
jgi:hypothetical protein